MAVLHADGRELARRHALPSRRPARTHTDTYENGYVTWGGTLDPDTQQWTIVSKGDAHTAPAGRSPQADADRRLAGGAEPDPAGQQPVWNYIYAGSGRTGGCDVDVGSAPSTSPRRSTSRATSASRTGAVTEGSNNPPTPVNVVIKGKVSSRTDKPRRLGRAELEAHLAGGSSLTNRTPARRATRSTRTSSTTTPPGSRRRSPTGRLLPSGARARTTRARGLGRQRARLRQRPRPGPRTATPARST